MLTSMKLMLKVLVARLLLAVSLLAVALPIVSAEEQVPPACYPCDVK